MALKVYYDLMSQPARSLIIYLKYCKIPFTECPIALRNGEHLSEDYAKINRFKKVPAIDHNGFKLAESVAIFRYISREFPAAEKLYPKNSQSQAKIDEFLEWHHINLRGSAAMYFMTKAILPRMTGKPVDENQLKSYGKKIEEAVNTIETLFIRNQPFLTGNEISVADVLAACELEQPLSVGYDIYGGHEKMSEWMKRVQNALQPYYNEVHAIVHKIGKNYPTKSKM
uniref:glutathione transferase n=1 Tax=Strigamia maritima TaxID=126957 RepID=T1IZ07_STRMM